MSEKLCKIINKMNNKDNPFIRFSCKFDEYRWNSGSHWSFEEPNFSDLLLDISVSPGESNYYVFDFMNGGKTLYNAKNKCNIIDHSIWQETYSKNSLKELNDCFDLATDILPGPEPSTEDRPLIVGAKIKKTGYYKINSRLFVESDSDYMFAMAGIFKFRPHIYLYKDPEYYEQTVPVTMPMVDISAYKAINSFIGMFKNESYNLDTTDNHGAELDNFPVSWNLGLSVTEANACFNPTELPVSRASRKGLLYPISGNRKISIEEYLSNTNYWTCPTSTSSVNNMGPLYYYTTLLVDGGYDKYGFYHQYNDSEISKDMSSINLNYYNYRQIYPIARTELKTISKHRSPLIINSKICYLNEGDIINLVYGARNTHTASSPKAHNVNFLFDDSFYLNIEYVGSGTPDETDPYSTGPYEEDESDATLD